MVGFGYWPAALLLVWLGVAWLNDLYDIPTAHNSKLAMGRITVADPNGRLHCNRGCDIGAYAH